MNYVSRGAPWFWRAKKRDVSTGPLARPFARSLAKLTHLRASPCSLRLRAPLRSFFRSLTQSQARGQVKMSILIHSLAVGRRRLVSWQLFTRELWNTQESGNVGSESYKIYTSLTYTPWLTDYVLISNVS